MQNKKAFTLIEVLIALLIIAIALAAAIRGTNESIRSTIHVRNTVTAHFVAMNLLSEMQTGMQKPPSGNNARLGQTAMLDQNWDWAIEKKNTDPLTHDVRVVITVSLKKKVVTVLQGYVPVIEPSKAGLP